jgi:hypothetical protein
MIKLIWTYDDSVGKSFIGNEYRITLINYYILSINNAKSLGYHTIIYTTNTSKKYFIEVVDEIIIIEKPYETKIFDYLKIYVLETRNDKFCLIDGDLIIHKKLPEFTEDVMFDTIEEGIWEIEYETIVKQFDKMGIKNVVNFWTTDKLNTMNLGILSFNNNNIKNEYVKLWKEVNEWVNNQTEFIDFDLATMVVSQYLLTIICKKENINTQNLRDTPSNINGFINGEFYSHYFGDHKFEKKIVPFNEIIKNKKSLI